MWTRATLGNADLHNLLTSASSPHIYHRQEWLPPCCEPNCPLYNGIHVPSLVKSSQVNHEKTQNPQVKSVDHISFLCWEPPSGFPKHAEENTDPSELEICPFCFSNLIPIPFHIFPATLAFPHRCQAPPVSGPLRLLSPLPGMLSAQNLTWLTPSPHSLFLTYHLPVTSPWTSGPQVPASFIGSFLTPCSATFSS